MSDNPLEAFKINSPAAGAAIGGEWRKTSGRQLSVKSPIDGGLLGMITGCANQDVDAVIDAAADAFKIWRSVPAPKRGEFVRRIGNKLRERKSDLAKVVQLEVGKITQEALGEVQEMIDICDFAVGLSRQLYGLTIASERPGHRMMEQWHPLGPIGVITAFNFPVAVWAWNAMIAVVCGDTVVWKPSEKTPLSAIAVHRIIGEVLAEMKEVPAGVMGLVIGERDIGEQLAASEKLPLISATGSVRMGRALAPVVAQRLGRSLLELGGNNAMIVTPTADLELAIRAIVFAAVGTAGQRCTSLRRLIVHRSIKDQVVKRLDEVYRQLMVGDPRCDVNHIGPLIDEAAFNAMQAALDAARSQGGVVIPPGGQRENLPFDGFYVRPALVEIAADAPIVKEETFAPILYVLEYDSPEQAIAMHNDVPQGLSSAIFTSDVREAETFLSPSGSDCGIANVNIGTSGAEIGGAFGGEKWTGGGRESGSDSWKAYMRRVTNTINYSSDLPLAQGISFTV